MKEQKKQNRTPWRVINRKPVLLLALLLICVAVFSAAVQADEVDKQEQRQDLLEPVIVSETRGPQGTDVVIQIPTAQDAFISSALSNTTFGGSTELRLGYDQSDFQAMRFLMYWDIFAYIPPNAVINNATASIYQTYVTPSGDTLAVQGQYVTALWNESTVTWNNANYLGGDITQVGDVDSGIGWKSVNVTDIVRTWYSGTRPNYGTILTADERDWQNRNRIFLSRQSGSAPYLTVDYTLACDNVPPVASVNQLPTFSASSFTVTWSGTDYAQSGCTPSGIAYYDVQYTQDGSNWVSWQNQVTSTSATFEGGQNNIQYSFRARAVDNAGNVQSWTGAQAATTVDTQAPNATVNPLPEYTQADNFFVTWGGTDNLSGIANYDVQYKVGDGPWLLGLQETTLTSYHVTGVQNGETYYFRTRATDNVGNVQPWPPDAQTQTTIITEPISEVLPFDPPVLKPTAPITDSFVVRWQGFPQETIVSYQIFYQYDGGSWSSIEPFTANELSYRFYYPNGDGQYGFESVATNSAGLTETRNYRAEASITVDMADAFHKEALLPIIFNSTTP